jgi:arylsulfatase
MRYPPFTDKIAGKILQPFSTVMDIMPTMLDLADVSHPAPGPDNGTYRNHEVFPMRGKSWSSYFRNPTNERAAIHTDDDPAIGWEMYGRAALRKGDWKILWMPIDAYGKAKWELFDLATDPGETNDLADERPEKVQELLVEWEKYVKETGVVWGAPFSDAGIEDWMHLPEDSVGKSRIALRGSKRWVRILEGKGQTDSK